MNGQAHGRAELPVAPAPGAGAPPLAEEMDRLLACVHCGFCLPVCPTYTRLGDEADSPRGRLALMRAVAEGRLAADAEALATHLDRCLGCRACEPVCPAGVEYGHLLERAREVVARETGVPLATRALLAAFRRRPIHRLALAFGRVLRSTGLAALAARRLPRRWARLRFGLAMLAATRPWPGLGAAGPRSGTPAPGPERGAGGSRALRVALLRGCVQDGLFGRVNAATARVLSANGCELVDVPGQRCCGALHAHGGDLAGARELARSNVRAFLAAGADVIAVNAAGCGSAMKAYGELLAGDPAAAEAAEVASRVRDLSELLVELGPQPPDPVPLRVAYDAPCHLHHAQRVTRAPLELLDAVQGIERVPLPRAEECCGGAGIYGLMHPELGGRILEDKVDAILGTGADAVVTPNPGCMMQIGAGLLLAGAAVPVLHPVEILDAGYRRSG